MAAVWVILNESASPVVDSDFSDHRKWLDVQRKLVDSIEFDFGGEMMKTDGLSSMGSRFRVFTGNESDSPDCNSSLVNRQLPFLPELLQCFESVSGWKLSFYETSNNGSDQNAIDDEIPVCGRLQISDMSESVEAGKPARHRGSCDSLAGILDQMVRRIQSDRKQIQNTDRRLNRAVAIPFEWWGLTGNTGFRNGRFSTWTVSANEKIRMFAGQLEADGTVNSAICSATVLAAFETACQASVELHEVASLLPSVLQKTANAYGKFLWFAATELDTITGDYTVSGFNATKGSTLIDIGASAVMKSPDNEHTDTLYSGQILGLGVNHQQRLELNEILSNTEMTIHEFDRIVHRRFADWPALFLYRN